MFTKGHDMLFSKNRPPKAPRLGAQPKEDRNDRVERAQTQQQAQPSAQQPGSSYVSTQAGQQQQGGGSLQQKEGAQREGGVAKQAQGQRKGQQLQRAHLSEEYQSLVDVFDSCPVVVSELARPKTADSARSRISAYLRSTRAPPRLGSEWSLPRGSSRLGSGRAGGVLAQQPDGGEDTPPEEEEAVPYARLAKPVPTKEVGRAPWEAFKAQAGEQDSSPPSPTLDACTPQSRSAPTTPELSPRGAEGGRLSPGWYTWRRSGTVEASPLPRSASSSPDQQPECLPAALPSWKRGAGPKGAPQNVQGAPHLSLDGSDRPRTSHGLSQHQRQQQARQKLGAAPTARQNISAARTGPWGGAGAGDWGAGALTRQPGAARTKKENIVQEEDEPMLSSPEDYDVVPEKSNSGSIHAKLQTANPSDVCKTSWSANASKQGMSLNGAWTVQLLERRARK